MTLTDPDPAWAQLAASKAALREQLAGVAVSAVPFVMSVAGWWKLRQDVRRATADVGVRAATAAAEASEEPRETSTGDPNPARPAGPGTMFVQLRCDELTRLLGGVGDGWSAGASDNGHLVIVRRYGQVIGSVEDLLRYDQRGLEELANRISVYETENPDRPDRPQPDPGPPFAELDEDLDEDLVEP